MTSTTTQTIITHTNKTTSQTTRTTQLHCPIGSYCVNGVRKVCPAGKYGRTKGLTTSKCSGKCLKGYYCPQESSYPSQTLRLDIAANNMKPCPKGKYQNYPHYFAELIYLITVLIFLVY